MQRPHLCKALLVCQDAPFIHKKRVNGVAKYSEWFDLSFASCVTLHALEKHCIFLSTQNGCTYHSTVHDLILFSSCAHFVCAATSRIDPSITALESTSGSINPSTSQVRRVSGVMFFIDYASTDFISSISFATLSKTNYIAYSSSHKERSV